MGKRRMKRHLNSSTDGQLGEGTTEAKLSKEKKKQPRGEEQNIHLHRDGQAVMDKGGER